MSDTVVHPSAIVAPGAQLGKGVKIGPYSIVGENVVLGDNVELISHAVVEGRTSIGADSRIFPFASVGHQPQDLKFHGEASRVEIGERCTIRESVTINPGTEGGGMLTKIGDDCLLMACSHVAHDARVGNNVVLANYVGIAGHAIVGDHVRFGGICAVHQFVRIGEHAFIGAHSMVDADVIPYGLAVGNRARLAGLNLVGLKRRGFERESIHRLRAAYRQIFASEGTLRERVEDAAELFKGDRLVQDVVAFIAAASDRPILLPRSVDLEDSQ
ncbi:MAG: acyl-ACP--UDP-N-acetylglucosamine O-acyltransferase [Candidatus Devosia phytovorans]|uniref:Acyl-[acyl-carrier-protein]--UDP-N-acetylglucosamine O-acyltransferase n=1 Tax=Candidatus Devosia phytovorans TaxID=3121372 RepID=A0AAJ5VYT1_9HYPH|nr:acyl-ACP--UDP-N-acetylglucosamine O-acyltransferase [Devosia sp.]WEK05927.1 MAG: acyl-ACP--UDP-N-acetylglucosamine O-acyltransferase [Devosia sp.]